MRDTISDNTDEDSREDIEEYIDEITDNASAVSDQLKGARFGTFQMLNSLKAIDSERIA